MSLQITFRHIPCLSMSETEIQECSNLFSNHYGIWGDYPDHPEKKGKNIRMTPPFFRKTFLKPNRYIIMAFCKEKLVGHVVYLKAVLPSKRKKKTISWILQIVVDKEYRGEKIGVKMMHSIWGMSNYAWGLYTAHPLTVATLEQATLRNVNPQEINKHLNELKIVSDDLFDDKAWINEYHDCKVRTKFYISHDKIEEQTKKSYPNGQFPFGQLEEGEEWLAFVFKNQPLGKDASQLIRERIAFDMERLKQAYANMKMEEQTWAQYAQKEIDWLISEQYITPGARVLDLGCGTGRHGKALQAHNVNYKGIDFIESRIKEANQNNVNYPKILYEVGDVRNYYDNKKYDTVLCLYDVIGSFPVDRDNHKILSSAYRNLKNKGYFVLSVMNLETTLARCRKSAPKHIVYDIRQNIQALLDLEPSTAMQNTGEVFNSKKLIVDKKTDIVYRKEQFTPQNQLPSELFVQDKRYTARSITKHLLRHGFSVVKLKYVKAGEWSKSENIRAKTSNKEILVVARKENYIYSLINCCKSFFI